MAIINKSNYVSQGWDCVKYRWKLGFKGKVMIIVGLAICILATQVIYISTSVKVNSEVIDSETVVETKVERNEEMVITMSNLSEDIKNMILLEISTIYSRNILEQNKFNVKHIEFKAPQTIFDNGNIEDKVYALNDSGTVTVEYIDGIKLEKEYLFEYKYDIDNMILLESNIEIFNIEEEYIKKQDIDNTEDMTNTNKNPDISNENTTSENSNKNSQYLLKLYTIEEELTNTKATEAQMYRAWDDELNVLYSILKERLSKSDMDKLTEKQIEWLDYRDTTAQGIANSEAEQYQEGRLNFELARLTKERCYELVNNYL